MLLRDLLFHLPREDYVIAFSPTISSQNMLLEILPASSVFSEFSQAKLEACVTLQKELVSQGKKRSLLIVLDDCMYSKVIDPNLYL